MFPFPCHLFRFTLVKYYVLNSVSFLCHLFRFNLVKYYVLNSVSFLCHLFRFTLVKYYVLNSVSISLSFIQIHDESTFWKWSETVMLPGLYDNTWYNGEEFDPKKNLISDRKLFLVSLPRLRQARVRPGKL